MTCGENEFWVSNTCWGGYVLASPHIDIFGIVLHVFWVRIRSLGKNMFWGPRYFKNLVQEMWCSNMILVSPNIILGWILL
jgi:hypothetical protein